LFRPEQSIHQVMQTFIKHRISGGPVVDEKGILIGIISEADCMKEISDSRYFNMPILDKSVQHFMTKNVDTIESNISIFDAAAKFSKSSRRRYPVLENGYLVGQISRKDIVIAAINMKSQTWRIK
jgi:CBS domain-containing protein